MPVSLRFCLWAVLLAPRIALCDDVVPPPAEKSPKLEFLLKESREHLFHPISNEQVQYSLQEAPLFRWQNPISGADGAIFVWTQAGRPVLLSKCHVNDKTHGHITSMVSIATERFVMKRGGTTLWTPDEPGRSPKPVSEAAPPADSATARLVQMRAIARRYRFLSVWGQEESSEWELRLLPTPMMRFSSDEAGVLDGAIFGFAQGTNPEAVVVVEAVTANGKTEWQSAPCRLSGYAIRGWFDKEQVLDVPRIQTTRNNETYRHVYRKLAPYPFAE
jgi:hypothetical protein